MSIKSFRKNYNKNSKRRSSKKRNYKGGSYSNNSNNYTLPFQMGLSGVERMDRRLPSPELSPARTRRALRGVGLNQSLAAARRSIIRKRNHEQFLRKTNEMPRHAMSVSQAQRWLQRQALNYDYNHSLKGNRVKNSEKFLRKKVFKQWKKSAKARADAIAAVKRREREEEYELAEKRKNPAYRRAERAGFLNRLEQSNNNQSANSFHSAVSNLSNSNNYVDAF